MRFINYWQRRKYLNEDQHRQKDTLSFLPAALEIQHRPPHPLTRIILWSMTLLLLLAILWACLGRLDIVITGAGKLVPSGQVKVIQSLEKGTVHKIFVHNGQLVHKNDALIALDQSFTQNEIDYLTKQLKQQKITLYVNQAFYQLLKSGEEKSLTLEDIIYFFLENAPERNTTGEHLLWQKWQAYAAQIASLKSQIAKVQNQIVSADNQIAMLEEMLPIVKEQHDMLAHLYAQNYTSKAEYLKLKQTLIEKQKQLSITKAQKKEQQAVLQSVESQLSLKKAEYFVNALEEIQQTQEKISSLQTNLEKQKRLYDKFMLKAPITGYVHELMVHTINEVVSPAKVLLKIIPKDDILEVSAIISNQDIGYIHEGQDVVVKIDTFPFTEYGYIEGKVRDISEDAVQDERLGLIYKVSIHLAKQRLSVNNKNIRLIPGMSVRIEIKTGQRRIIDYFLHPLIKGLEESLRER